MLEAVDVLPLLGRGPTCRYARYVQRAVPAGTTKLAAVPLNEYVRGTANFNCIRKEIQTDRASPLLICQRPPEPKDQTKIEYEGCGRECRRKGERRYNDGNRQQGNFHCEKEPSA